MSGSRRTRRTGGLTLDELHDVIDASVKISSPLDSPDLSCNVNESFDDALHRLVNATPRPKSKSDISNICSLLNSLIAFCDLDTQDGDTRRARWTSFLLAILHKRYHLRAPEAKAEMQRTGSKKASAATGDGERLIFYVAVSCLLKYSIHIQRKQVEKQNPESCYAVNSAIQCLFSLCPWAGGSRDICALIENGIRTILSDFLSKRENQFSPIASMSKSELIGCALSNAMASLEEKNSPSRHVEMLIVLAAQTLDSDLKIISDKSGHGNGGEEKMISTLNVFLPHRDRGRLSGNKRQLAGNKRRRENKNEVVISNRNLIQCVAELLIWSNTATVSGDDFGKHFDDLMRSNKSPEMLPTLCPEERQEYKETIKAHLHKMQTIVRRQRKILNSHARSQGFMLSDLYVHDPRSISLWMVKRGKAGDLARLAALAGKSRATRVLDMLNIRNSDPSRAVPMDSLSRLRRSWIPLDGDDKDEVRAAKLKLQEATVRSTIKHLRDRCRSLQAPSCLVASLDDSSMNHAACILVSAALSVWADETKEPTKARSDGDEEPSEEAGCEERQTVASVRTQRAYVKDRLIDVSSFGACMESLEDVFHSSVAAESLGEAAEGDAAATKDVLNLIDRHVSDGDTLVLFASADLQLPSHSIADLKKRGCSIHCHNTDDLAARLRREGAQTGDVTISLSWDTGDDLDLHVVMPSGEEIMFNNKKSRCGLGCLDVDMNAGGAKSFEPVENVILGNPDELIEAPRGKYKVFVQNYSYHSSKQGEPVNWRVSVRMNGRVDNYVGTCVGTGETSDVIVCEFDYKGRNIPFEKELKDKSVFGTSNLVSITASMGQTLESLCQLMHAAEEHRELHRIRDLVDCNVGEDGTDTADKAEENADNNDDDAAAESTMKVDEGDVRAEEDAEPTAAESDQAGPLVAPHGSLEITSRDRLHMLLCKLPRRFHDEVFRCFGGETLMERCAADVSRRMMRDDVHLSDLKSSGYPKEIVEMVSSVMRKGAVAPAT